MKKTTEKALREHMQKTFHQLQIYIHDHSWLASWSGNPTLEARGATFDDAVNNLLEKTRAQLQANASGH